MIDVSNTQEYVQLLSLAIRDLPFAAMDGIVDNLLHAYTIGATVYVFGNGGSAATASHFACDLAKGTAKWLDRSDRRFRVVSLTDNVPILTAWGNDSEYADIFAEQLRNMVQPDDVAFAISGSGNSPNILRALEVAKDAGAQTIGLTGFGGGRMKPLCASCVIVGSDNMEVIEDAHMCICHAVATVIRTCLTQDSCARAAAREGIHVMRATDSCSESGTDSRFGWPIQASTSLPQRADHGADAD